MSGTLGIDDPPGWFGRVQRAYMATGDEAMLQEAADLGRLMAVTDIAMESVIEVYGEVLADALAAASPAESGRLVAAAGTVLSELMVACRLASQNVPLDDDPTRQDGPPQSADDRPPEFLRFRPGGALDGDPPGDVYRWLGTRVGQEISLAARTAVDRYHTAMFEVAAAAGGNPLRLIICPFRDGGGVIAIRDATSLIDARERAFQRRKLESVGQVASGLAHELGNLLQPIYSMAQMAREDHPDDGDLAEALGVILDSTRRAAEIVHGMLLYVRRSPKGLQQIRLASALASGAEAVRRMLPPGVCLELRTGAAESRVAAHPGELDQIIKNLVNNAMHAVSGHGVVTIGLDELRVANALAVRMRIAAGSYARLTVSDTGPGIAPAMLERVFEPFFTTKRIGEGTGLGLSVVQGIVKSWAGSITARNLPEGGAAFEILLPLVDASVGADDNDRACAAMLPAAPAVEAVAQRNGQGSPPTDHRA